MLVDGFGRELTEIRVSLTDRCNFDCVYCHNEGLGDTRGPMAPRDEEMTTDEVVRVLSVAADLDVQAVKLTGGEPMLREDLEEIVRRAPEGMEVSLTTNGSFLPDRAEGLVEAGLERVNVSQDAVDPEAFAEITQSGAYDRVIEGVDAALEAGLDPVKLNMVVFEGTAEYIPEMVDRVAEREGLRLQLIEYMPEIAGHPEWAIDIERVHEWLAERADRVETRDMHDRKRYFVAGDEGEGMVEVVDPVENEMFCDNCHRVRVTHDGSLKGCLNRPRVHPMGELTEAEIRAAFHEVVADRVPYYGEFMIEEDGEWVRNDEYVGEQLVVEGPSLTADDD
ncbi:GTP 3',8-cyclase MoaA [Halapricum desulfuricans]|uniref:Probable GTP 3',8-cyclase n=1 Tax=Halapricum desulfuricans TaxID=2841257 RepID=A0A897NG95_9EURY|nr:GTP 3',8-cyclase MoaA [Halapricum desulfuricans]QSG09919.1 Molybdenum cofactor biosynthesis enzyme [Halapricum desulfuricans]QSG10993.1 Molybdenum cofactor biosynthesis enzyme [Halapricum desulfuricans]